MVPEEKRDRNGQRTNLKMIDSQKPKRREHKHKIKGNHQTTKRKTKKKKEQRRNKESTGKQGLIRQ